MKSYGLSDLIFNSFEMCTKSLLEVIIPEKKQDNPTVETIPNV